MLSRSPRIDGIVVVIGCFTFVVAITTFIIFVAITMALVLLSEIGGFRDSNFYSHTAPSFLARFSFTRRRDRRWCEDSSS